MNQKMTDMLDAIDRASFLIGTYGDGRGNAFRTERDAARAALIAEIERLEEQTTPVAFAEREPEPFDLVLVYDPAGLGMWYKVLWNPKNPDWIAGAKVNFTHWLPMPPAPKEQDT